MARAFLPLGDSGVRYSRSDAGTGSMQTHYTRSVLSLHGRREGASGFLADHAARELARGFQGRRCNLTPIGGKVRQLSASPLLCPLVPLSGIV
jgi:hypothetical protein